MTTAAYLLGSTAFLVAFGLGWAALSATGPLSPGGRIGLAYGLGSFALALEATVFSLARVRWSVAALALPLLIFSVVLLVRTRRGQLAEAATPRPPLTAVAAVVLASTQFGASIAVSVGTSVDFVLFYGVKAVHFAQARGLDNALLGHPFFVHGAPRYPPLMPIVEAWGILVAGGMPWRFAPLISFVWFLSAAAAIWARLRRRLGADAGAALAAFWSVALAFSLAWSSSGGNGEAPLVFYLSVAGAWLLTETTGESRFLAAICLGGAAFTKQEGLLSALAMAGGVLLRDLLLRRPAPLRRAAPLLIAPLASVALWFAWERSAHLPAGYSSPTDVSRLDLKILPDVAIEMLRNMNAGAYGVSWIVPLVLLLLSGRRIIRTIPAVAVIVAISGSLLVTYLAPMPVDRAVVIIRTMNRAIQPALSLLILAAGVAWFGRDDAEEGR